LIFAYFTCESLPLGFIFSAQNFKPASEMSLSRQGKVKMDFLSLGYQLRNAAISMQEHCCSYKIKTTNVKAL